MIISRCQNQIGALGAANSDETFAGTVDAATMVTMHDVVISWGVYC